MCKRCDCLQKSNSSKVYYVVTNGRNPGIYKEHEQAQEQIRGYSFGKMRKVKGLAEAKAYFAAEKKRASKDKVYYVVKVGKRPGLYLDKQKALEQIYGYPHGKMKRIKGYEQAQAFLNHSIKLNKTIIPNIFIDGSYIQEHKISGYGMLVEEGQTIIQQDCGTILDFDLINLHSLGAELYALLRAMEWGMANGYKEIRIIYDSDAIIQIIEQGETNKARKSKGRTKFLKLFAEYKKFIKVECVHKNSKEYWTQKHELAHNLSRITSDILEQSVDFKD